jgi:hypothetical protein
MGVSVSKRAWTLSVALLLPSCGGGSSMTATPVPTPSPTPPVAGCSQTVLFQGAAGVAAGTAAGQDFVVPASADTRVDVATDWTYPSSLIGVYVISGGCSLDQFNARTCTFLMKSEPSAVKPRVISASNVTPGTYTLVIVDYTSLDESIATQVTLSNASCPAVATTLSSAPISGQGAGPSVLRMIQR